MRSIASACAAGALPNSVANTPRGALSGEQNVVGDGVVLEHRRLLELAADAEQGDVGLVEAREIVTRPRKRRRLRRAASCR